MLALFFPRRYRLLYLKFISDILDIDPVADLWQPQSGGDLIYHTVGGAKDQDRLWLVLLYGSDHFSDMVFIKEESTLDGAYPRLFPFAE